jgi:hypothetical protein
MLYDRQIVHCTRLQALQQIQGSRHAKTGRKAQFMEDK